MDQFFRPNGMRAGLLAAAIVASAIAQKAGGFWTRADGSARIQLSPCGAALCGVVVWLKNPASKAHVGQLLFFDMIDAD